MTRDDIIRMAREAGMEVHERKGQIRIGSAVLTGCDSTEQVERFAALVAAHVLGQRAPAVVLNTDDIDPALLRDMLAKAPPMQLLPAPAEPTPEAIAAAVAAEREACAQVCDSFADQWHDGYAIEKCAASIRARGAA